MAPLSFWLLSRVGFPSWPADPSPEFFGWERDRVLAVAKGTATSATGFLTSMIVALLKEEIKIDVPGIAVLGCMLARPDC
ncbi:hypothetical protein [Amycolatopsis sp. cmx-8-4]|uniref:hypothetical protein n=1 Tax=Amycolatopsis sp. cmx-8-4 TaxID=2790947 RepID=UPI00397A19F7